MGKQNGYHTSELFDRSVDIAREKYGLHGSIPIKKIKSQGKFIGEISNTGVWLRPYVVNGKVSPLIDELLEASQYFSERGVMIEVKGATELRKILEKEIYSCQKYLDRLESIPKI